MVSGVTVLVLAGALLLRLYDVFYFAPYQDAIAEMIHNAPQAHKNPPPALRRLVKLAFKDREESAVARSLLVDLNLNRGRSLSWQIHFALWTFFLTARYEEKDILTLWCHFAPYGYGRGLNDGALHFFKKELKALTAAQLATLVTLADETYVYRLRPKLLGPRAKALLNEFQKTER